jgi:hypothetical protein
MTSTGRTDAVATDPARTIARLRGSSMSLLVMLIIQFALGTAVNIYITPHKGGLGEAFSNGALLALHSVLGILLILAAIDLLIRSIMAGHRVVIVTSAIGLIALLGAAFNGVGFLKHHNNGASLGMALTAAVAMLCYAVALRVLSSSSSERAGA